MTRQRFIMFSLSILLTLSGPAWASEAVGKREHGVSPYTLTVIPFYGPEKLWALYSPLVAHLKQTTGQPWELKLYHNHDALIEGLCNGEVSLALLGPVPLGRANRKCGVKPLLVALGRDGQPFYRSIIVTSEPAIKDLHGLRGKTFGLFKGSTAAHIIPLKMLKDAGLGADAIKPVFFEGQDRIMTALLTHEVAAAGVKEAMYRKFEQEPLKALKTSDPLPNFSFCTSPRVKPRTYARLVKQLLLLKPLARPADARIVKAWDDEIKHGFVTPDADFLPSVMQLNSIYQEFAHEAR